jgi:hypothetical protein
MNENKTNQQNVQTNVQGNQANNQEIQKMIQQQNEEKTVVNGKVVPLKQAQAMEEHFNKQNTQTGIQPHHDNSTESVPAGQVAGNYQQASQDQMQQQAIKQVNIQSGQSTLDSYEQVAQQEMQKAEQQFQQGQKAQQQQAQQQKAQQQAQEMSDTLQQKVENAQTIQDSISQKAKAKTKTNKGE